MDLPPPPPPAHYAPAPGDIYPLDTREKELCATASHPDWLYLGGLLAIDTGAIWFGSSSTVKYATSIPLSYTGPAIIGLTWGATVGGGWLLLPKCSPEWVTQSSPHGPPRADWPIALALALLAGATAPIVNGIAIGYDLPPSWSTGERVLHVVTAGVAGFGGALLPYLFPPRTWSAAKELERIRVTADGRGALSASYLMQF